MSQGLAESYAGKTESVPRMTKIILFYKIQNCTRFFQTITKAYMDIYTKEVKVHGKKCNVLPIAHSIMDQLRTSGDEY